MPVRGSEGKMELEKLYLIEGTQGQGLGLKFFQHIVVQAKAAGIHSIWLNVYDQNISAIEFYKRLGFIKIGERDFKYLWNGQSYQDNDWIMEFQC